MKTVRNLCQILCILVAMLAFTNCQTDTDTVLTEEQAMQKAFPYTKSVLTQQEVAANTKLSNQLRGLATMQQQLTENNTYDFTVHTERVHYIESTENNTHSYTFPISRTNGLGTALENMVFSYNASTEDYTATLVTYHFNALQQQEFFSTQHVGTPYEISSETIDMNIADVLGESNTVTPCTTTYTVYHITPAPNSGTFLYSINGNVQNACEHEQDDDPCDTYTVIEVNCPDGGSSGSTTDDPQNPSSPTSGSTSGGSGTTNNDDDRVVTTPVSKDEMSQLIDELNDAFGEDNWEFVDEVSDEAPNFNSVDEVEDFFSSLTSEESTHVSSEAVLGQENIRKDVNKIKFTSFPRTDFVTSIKIDVPETGVNLSHSNLKNIRTRLEGNNTFFDWTQYDSENPSDPDGSTTYIFENINSLVIHIEGEVQVGLNIEGNPLRIRRLITVSINYNYLTGLMQPQYCRWFYRY